MGSDWTRSNPVTINVPLLRKTLEHIEAHPEEWDQLTWRCETAMCFAGHAADLTGAQWVGSGKYITADPAIDHPLDIWSSGVTSASARAQTVLGLDEDQAAWLFAGSNTLDDLRCIVGELIEQAEATP